MLEEYIRERRQQRDILLMTHIVLGYPSFDASLRIVESMVEAGVELMELQIPFSEPMADGPVIVRANQEALARGATLDRSFEFAEQVSRRFDIPFLFMTYANLVYRAGVAAFIARAKACGIKGLIVPDLPPEEAADYSSQMQQASLSPVFILAPTSSNERLKQVASCSSGFVYCVARKGVTGAHTAFSEPVKEYLQRARSATQLPLAVGFGVTEKSDVDFLRGLADIAVVGSQTIRLIDSHGISAVAPFIKSLRDS